MTKINFVHLFLLLVITLPIGCSPKVTPSKDSSQISQSPQNRRPNDPTKNPKKRAPHPFDPGRRSSSKLDLGLGQANLGNTCFANSVHKLLWAHPGILEATSPEAPLSDDRLKETGTHLQSAFHKLMQNFTDTAKDDSELKHSAYNKTELNQVFDRMEDTLWADTGSRYLERDNESTALRNPNYQNDAVEYFLKFQNYLDLPQNLGGFRLITQVHFDKGRPNQKNETSPEEIMLQLEIDGIDSVKQAVEKEFKRIKTEVPIVRDFPHLGIMKAIGERVTYLRPGSKGIPRAIYLTLKRFGQNYLTDENGNVGVETFKISKSITVSPTFRLRFFTENDKKKEITHWRIKGVVNHAGTLDGGHYYAYLYDHEKDQWIEHNDSSVSILKDDREIKRAKKDMNNNAYILLYERVNILPTY